jgi:hypothetical protein
MENLFILNEDHIVDMFYKALCRYFEEKNIDMLDKPIEEDNYDQGFYDRNELREQLHVSYPTLWRIEKAGLLDSVKVGRRKLYAKQDVNQLIESGKLANFNDVK